MELGIKIRWLRADHNALLGMERPWALIASVMFIVCGISVWLHNGGQSGGFLEDLYNFSPIIIGAAFCIMLNNWHIGFTQDWRWMVLMLILAALFWYAVPMGSLFR